MWVPYSINWDSIHIVDVSLLKQRRVVFLLTPTWRSNCLQVCMMSSYAYVPSDPSNKLTILFTQKQCKQLMVAVDCMWNMLQEEVPAATWRNLKDTKTDEEKNTKTGTLSEAKGKGITQWLPACFVNLWKLNLLFLKILASAIKCAKHCMQSRGDFILSSSSNILAS